MSIKKYWRVFLLMVLVFAFMALTLLPGEAAAKPHPINHPPECFPMQSYLPGTWGMMCTDQDENITSVSVDTDYKYSLNWNQSRVELVVYTGAIKKRPEPLIVWEVCDKAAACVGGVYP